MPPGNSTSLEGVTECRVKRTSETGREEGVGTSTGRERDNRPFKSYTHVYVFVSVCVCVFVCVWGGTKDE